MSNTFSVRRLLLLFPLALQAAAPCETKAQLAGTYRSAPGTVATFLYHHGEYESVLLPADVTMRFSADDPLSMTALIHKPIIGDTADFNYPIVNHFPMVVTGISTDGRTFYGELVRSQSQYGFEWTISPANSHRLHWDGQVAWMGGRVEISTIEDAELIPISPGDYNGNGSVDAADFVLWRKASGQSNTSPIGFLADGDGDGQVDEDDYHLWRAHFGETAPSTSPQAAGVPEPVTWLLLAVALPVLAFIRSAPNGHRFRV